MPSVADYMPRTTLSGADALSAGLEGARLGKKALRDEEMQRREDERYAEEQRKLDREKQLEVPVEKLKTQQLEEQEIARVKREMAKVQGMNELEREKYAQDVNKPIAGMYKMLTKVRMDPQNAKKHVEEHNAGLTDKTMAIKDARAMQIPGMPNMMRIDDGHGGYLVRYDPNDIASKYMGTNTFGSLAQDIPWEQMSKEQQVAAAAAMPDESPEAQSLRGYQARKRALSLADPDIETAKKTWETIKSEHKDALAAVSTEEAKAQEAYQRAENDMTEASSQDKRLPEAELQRKRTRIAELKTAMGKAQTKRKILEKQFDDDSKLWLERIGRPRTSMPAEDGTKGTEGAGAAGGDGPAVDADLESPMGDQTKITAPKSAANAPESPAAAAVKEPPKRSQAGSRFAPAEEGASAARGKDIKYGLKAIASLFTRDELERITADPHKRALFSQTEELQTLEPRDMKGLLKDEERHDKMYEQSSKSQEYQALKDALMVLSSAYTGVDMLNPEDFAFDTTQDMRKRENILASKNTLLAQIADEYESSSAAYDRGEDGKALMSPLQLSLARGILKKAFPDKDWPAPKGDKVANISDTRKKIKAAQSAGSRRRQQ